MMPNPAGTTTNFDDRKLIFSALTAGTVVAAVFMLLPLFVGVLATSYGFSEGQLGVIASMDVIGLALMSITAPLWIRRVHWRHVARGGLIWLILCNIASIYVTDFWLLGLVRLLSSISFGLVTVMVITTSSYTSNPDRFIALLVVFEVAFQAVGFQVMPGILESFGIPGFFHFLNVVLVVGLLVSVYFPVAGRSKEETAEHGKEHEKSMKPLVVLVGFALFFIAQVALFSFIERLGADAGFNPRQIGSALSIAVIIGLMGAVTGAVIATRFGRFPPLLVSGIGQITGYYLLTGSFSYSDYLLACVLIQVFWNLPLGQQVGVLVKDDPGHHWIVFVPFAQAVGITAGPALGGFILELAGYDGLLLLVTVAIVFYLILILPFACRQDRQSRMIGDAEPVGQG